MHRVVIKNPAKYLRYRFLPKIINKKEKRVGGYFPRKAPS